MKRIVALALLMVLTAGPAFALTANLTWTEPTPPAGTTITNRTVARGTSLTGPFTVIGTLTTVPASGPFFSDGGRTLGVTDCYQVVWNYNLGPSAPLTACATSVVGPAGTQMNILYTNP